MNQKNFKVVCPLQLAIGMYVFSAHALAADVKAGTAKLPEVSAAMQKTVENREIFGAVTLVVTKDRILHCDANGLADPARHEPMTAGSLFWIASMTKPVTAVAVLMLQDEGKLKVTDPVTKYIPEFGQLKTPSGQPANLTIAQLLTHTSGLGEAAREQAATAHTLADLIPLFLAAPMQFEPGTKWSYCQSGINTASRIVEIVSAQSFDVFLQRRIFGPLGMKNTTFYLAQKPGARLAVACKKDATTGELEAMPPPASFGMAGRPPMGNGGLFSTGPDYARFCQMLLGGGVFAGKRYLSPQAMKLLTTVQTGELPTGFFQSSEFGNHGSNYGWGIGTCVLRAPHAGVASMLSPGTFGHGGAWGTQAWIDPKRGVAYVLMVQRANFPNSDASEVRRAFQQAAADALEKAQPARHSFPSGRKFRVLALAEPGGHHLAFTRAAKPWLKQCGDENGFEVDYITNTKALTEARLAKYRLVLQLDFAPYGWKPEAMAAFKSYIEEGKGGWVGLHHAALLGEFDGYPMWPWFSDFLGKIRYKNYIPNFASGTVRVEDKLHPCMKEVPGTFVVPREEWYTWDRSPRPNVRVLASVDEASYSPDSDIKMGDHPVIWTNERLPARNVYIFMGHGPDLLENSAFTTILRNAILWAAGR